MRPYSTTVKKLSCATVRLCVPGEPLHPIGHRGSGSGAKMFTCQVIDEDVFDRRKKIKKPVLLKSGTDSSRSQKSNIIFHLRLCGIFRRSLRRICTACKVGIVSEVSSVLVTAKIGKLLNITCNLSLM